MAVAIGTNVVTSIGRRHIMPEFVDNVYEDNVVFFRLNQSGKKLVQGGTQIELPLMYSRFVNGGFFRGFDRLNTAPNDTVRNGAWDWKQAYVPVSVDSLTLIKTDSPDAVANFIGLYFAQAEQEMAEILGDAIWTAPANTKYIDALSVAVDSSNPTLENYGGIDRATNTWWAAYEDASTTTLTLPPLQTMFGSLRVGGRRPTLIVSRQANYDRYWNLAVSNQTIMQGPVAMDQQLYAAGFDNLLFNGVPWVVDHHVPSNSEIYMLNEDYIKWVVNSKNDFVLTPFQAPTDQSAMTARVEWAGNLIVTNCKRQGKMTAVAA